MQAILVADDDRTTRHLIGSLLESLGYVVTTAADGHDALDLARRTRFDLVLADVRMPRLSGLELLAELAQLDSPPRAMVMTADDTPETVIQAVQRQAYRYVRKPIDPKILAEIVRDLLESKPASRPIQVLSARPEWVELLVPCEMQSVDRIHGLLTSLDTDLPEELREAVALAFRELLMNAVEWGGKLDATRDVRIAYLRAKRMVLYRIADPGQGFTFGDLSHSAVSNSTIESLEHLQVREEKGLRPGGFGLLMTRALVDELIYNEAQNEVVFVKYLDEEKKGAAAT